MSGCSASIATALHQYPRLDDVARLAARFDPDGKFRNAWIDSIL